MNGRSKRPLLLLLTIGVSVFVLGSAASARAPSQSTIIKTLFDNAHVILSAKQSCGDDPSTPITVGAFIQRTLTFLAEETENAAQIQAACTEVMLDAKLVELYAETVGKPAERSLGRLKRGELLHECEVTFRYASGENVWSRGIQFLVRDRTGKAVSHSFRCHYTP